MVSTVNLKVKTVLKRRLTRKQALDLPKYIKTTCWLTSGNLRQHRPVKEPASLDLHAVCLYATMCPHSRAKRSTKKVNFVAALTKTMIEHV